MEVVDVTDILIRGVPDDELRRIDAAAERQGLSRNEYVKRLLSGEAQRRPGQVTRADLERFSRLAADLDDPEVMRQAWF